MLNAPKPKPSPGSQTSGRSSVLPLPNYRCSSRRLSTWTTRRRPNNEDRRSLSCLTTIEWSSRSTTLTILVEGQLWSRWTQSSVPTLQPSVEPSPLAFFVPVTASSSVCVSPNSYDHQLFPTRLLSAGSYRLRHPARTPISYPLFDSFRLVLRAQ